jgi:hypothetical protein
VLFCALVCRKITFGCGIDDTADDVDVELTADWIALLDAPLATNRIPFCILFVSRRKRKQSKRVEFQIYHHDHHES